MAVRNTKFEDGTTNWGSEVVPSADLNDTNNAIIDSFCPVGGMIPWNKTLGSKSSGTADTDTADKLVDSGATFQTDGVQVGMIVHNTTDDVFGVVSAVDSETSLSLAADVQAGSAVTDVFPDGDEGYVVYATKKLSTRFYEVNGQTISDSDSVYDGVTLPDYNVTQSFIRGSTSSGTTGGADSVTLVANNLPEHTHAASIDDPSPSGTGTFAGGSSTDRTIQTGVNTTTNVAFSILPTYGEAVWIIRVK